MSASNTGMVRFRLDAGDLPQMTEEQKTALHELRDADLDLKDIPEQAGARWRRLSELIPEGNKLQVTLRLDPDVLLFFKATGRRYQSRINAALREYMEAHRKNG